MNYTKNLGVKLKYRESDLKTDVIFLTVGRGKPYDSPVIAKLKQTTNMVLVREPKAF